MTRVNPHPLVHVVVTEYVDAPLVGIVIDGENGYVIAEMGSDVTERHRPAERVRERHFPGGIVLQLLRHCVDVEIIETIDVPNIRHQNNSGWSIGSYPAHVNVSVMSPPCLVTVNFTFTPR